MPTKFHNNMELEIWGRAQHQAAWHRKLKCFGPKLLICQVVNYICGKMTLLQNPLTDLAEI